MLFKNGEKNILPMGLVLLGIQMLNSVPQDLVAPQQGDPQEQEPHIYQLLLYKLSSSHPWLGNEDVYSLGWAEEGGCQGFWQWSTQNGTKDW